jgi:uncharacterized protein (DUF427 family)
VEGITRPVLIEPAPGQESVWDYPRPPALDPVQRHVIVEWEGRVVADSLRPIRVLETSHPPVYAIPPSDVDQRLLRETSNRSVCEWKGIARYWDLVLGDRVSPAAAWSYAAPVAGFAAITDHLCFYPDRVDRCLVDGEQVVAQPGGFYGGWITSEVVGPFKGEPGTAGW